MRAKTAKTATSARSTGAVDTKNDLENFSRRSLIKCLIAQPPKKLILPKCIAGNTRRVTRNFKLICRPCIDSLALLASDVI